MKREPVDLDLLNRVAEAIQAVSCEGCPVAARDPVAAVEQARVGLRRLGSIDRRRRHAADLDERLDDLADGLIAVFERDPSLVGPLKRDYLCLAKRILLASRRP